MKNEPAYLKHILLRLNNIMSSVCEFLCVFLTILMIALVVLQIAGRYFLHTPLAWTEESARYCVVWAGLLGTTLSFRYGYDVLLFRRPKMKSKFFDILIRSIHFVSVAVFLGPVIWFAPGFLERQFARTSEILEIPSGYITAVVPAFSFIILYHAWVMLIYPDQNMASNDEHTEV